MILGDLIFKHIRTVAGSDGGETELHLPIRLTWW